ncbi:MAG: GYF domain-containing protein [Tepidisphaeraceae bacterium]|jgi:hypothetical protein
MSVDNWYYGRGVQHMGPVGMEQLRAMASRGDLLATDLVWKSGMEQWQAAESIAGLFESGAAPAGGALPIPPLPPPILGANPMLGYARQETVREESLPMRLLFPVARSGWAIAAGYLGLLSVLLVPAPVALIVGIYAINDIREDPKKHGMGRAIFGLIMGALGTVGLFLVPVMLLGH